MAINLRVFNHEEGGNVNLAIDFNAHILASNVALGDISYSFYFSFATNNRDTEGNTIPTLLAEAPTDLVLNGDKRSSSDSAIAYTDFTELIEDYLYDIVSGHTADQFTSGVSARPGIQF